MISLEVMMWISLMNCNESNENHCVTATKGDNRGCAMNAYLSVGVFFPGLMLGSCSIYAFEDATKAHEVFR